MLILRQLHVLNFNPRAPYGARLLSFSHPYALTIFQSTRPLRGATSSGRRAGLHSGHFNPRAPYGARPEPSAPATATTDFNPRAPYGARRGNSLRAPIPTYFNPRAPYGARLRTNENVGGLFDISIHAPLTGRDGWLRFCQRENSNFNPRAPYGARRHAISKRTVTNKFQSTRPLRGATKSVGDARKLLCISIHAPLTGRDYSGMSISAWRFNFNPRAPYGARPLPKMAKITMITFQSTRPLRGATVGLRRSTPTLLFQSTRPLRGATDCLR